MRNALKPLTEDAKKSNEEAKALAAKLSFKVKLNKSNNNIKYFKII